LTDCLQGAFSSGGGSGGGGGSVELLSSQELTEAATNITYTPDSALSPDTYAYLIVSGMVEPSDDGVQILLNLNDRETDGYYADGTRTSGDSTQIEDNNDKGWFAIKDETKQDESCGFQVIIFLANDTISEPYPTFYSQAFSYQRGYTAIGGTLRKDEQSIDKVKVSAQAGDLAAGSYMQVYGVKLT